MEKQKQGSNIEDAKKKDKVKNIHLGAAGILALPLLIGDPWQLVG